MRTYLAKRLLLIVPTLFGAAALVFFIMRVIPGDVALLIFGGLHTYLWLRLFRAPAWPIATPMLGVVLCAYLASPLSGRATADYRIAGWLMLVGVALWGLTWYLNNYVFKRTKHEFDPSHIDPSGPVN